MLVAPYIAAGCGDAAAALLSLNEQIPAGSDLDFIDDSLSRINERECEVVDLLVEDYSSREIGSSTKTTEAHRARINDKMRSDDLAHLVRMVLASRDA